MATKKEGAARKKPYRKPRIHLVEEMKDGDQVMGGCKTASGSGATGTCDACSTVTAS